MTSLSSGHNNNDMPPGSKPPAMLLEVERIHDVRKEDLKRHKGGSDGGGVTIGASAGLSASAALSSATVNNVASSGSSAINASASTMSSSSSADHLLVIVYSREDDYGEQSLVLASNNEWIVESWLDAIHLLINAKPSANMTCFVECMVDVKLMDLNTLGCEIPAERAGHSSPAGLLSIHSGPHRRRQWQLLIAKRAARGS